MKIFNLRIMTNKKYKELIKDREWALKNYARADRRIKELNHEIETLLFYSSELRSTNIRLKKEKNEEIAKWQQ